MKQIFEILEFPGLKPTTMTICQISHDYALSNRVSVTSIVTFDLLLFVDSENVFCCKIEITRRSASKMCKKKDEKSISVEVDQV